MVFKGLMVATASLGLMATPALAAGQPLPTVSTAQIVPASESADGAELTGGGNIVIIVLALVAVGLGIWAALDGNGNDDAPASP